MISVVCPQLLNEHSNHEVHLFEKENRPGGHANTVDFVSPEKEVVKVDSCVVSSPQRLKALIILQRICTTVPERMCYVMLKL